MPTVYIDGQNFGPPGSESLLQVVRYGATGGEYTVTAVVVESHTRIRATLVPGFSVLAPVQVPAAVGVHPLVQVSALAQVSVLALASAWALA